MAMALHKTKTSSISSTENFISSSQKNVRTQVKDFKLNLSRAIAKNLKPPNANKSFIQIHCLC